jgi:hypothetical protein
MHTGTHFTRHGLFGKFLRANPGNVAHNPGYLLADNEHRIVNVHITTAEMERIETELQVDNIIVIPLRHPARVYQSFLKRNKTLEMFIEQWDNMINVIAPRNPFYIHLDLPERRQEVDLIEKAINMKLPVSHDESEWKIYNSRAETHSMSLDEFPIDDIPERFIDFYESTRAHKPT